MSPPYSNRRFEPPVQPVDLFDEYGIDFDDGGEEGVEVDLFDTYGIDFDEADEDPVALLVPWTSADTNKYHQDLVDLIHYDQQERRVVTEGPAPDTSISSNRWDNFDEWKAIWNAGCLLYTSDAADE